MLLLSQRWLLWSRTRQDARILLPTVVPPQVAMTGLGFDVKNVAWCSLPLPGICGGEQLLVLG